jgi:hypothetical protein
MLSAVLAVVTVVMVQQLAGTERADRPLRNSPDATSKSPVAEMDNAYRFQRRPAAQPRAVQGVDPPPERRLLACDPGKPAGWTRVFYQPGTTVAGLDRSRVGDLHRADGTSQLTIDGCPIYRRAHYTRHGRSLIHDTAGTWFLVKPGGPVTHPR